MMVFLGHPDYDFVYRCEDRGPSLGNYVGIRKGESFVEPLPLTNKTKEWIETATSTKIDGNGIDGDGVFHGTPKGRVFVTVTKDCDEVFGKYPANLKKQKPIELIEKDSPRLRKQFETDVYDLIRKWTVNLTRTYYRDRYAFAEAACEDISALADRYFK
jgi:hypothetical protein